jgi:two-component system LytT family response regulator
MSEYTVLIVDDEPIARAGLRALLAEDAEVRVVGEAGNGEEAVRLIERLDPDIVLLDVQMPDLDGFGVLRRLERTEWPVVVFVTAFDAYAIEAFEVHAVDYLLKPFGDRRAREAVARAKERIRRAELESLGRRLRSLLEGRREGRAAGDVEDAPAGAGGAAGAWLRRIAYRAGDRVSFLPVEAVDWIEAADDYVRLHVAGEAHLVRGRIRDLQEKLDPAVFVRIHRSTIVNIERVKELRPAFHGDYLAVLVDGTTLKVSRTHSRELAARTGEFF